MEGDQQSTEKTVRSVDIQAGAHRRYQMPLFEMPEGLQIGQQSDYQASGSLRQQ